MKALYQLSRGHAIETVFATGRGMVDSKVTMEAIIRAAAYGILTPLVCVAAIWRMKRRLVK
jgi:hypothetical protein